MKNRFLAVIFATLFLFNIIQPAFAGGVGYIDYDKVFENYQYAKNSVREIETKGLEIQQYLAAKEEEFQKLYKETKLYIDNVERCWNENKDRINKYLKDILKVEIDIKLNVYISHPNCYNGYSFGENNVVWGHYKGIEDSNYNLVYLVHEGLHHLIPFEVNDNELVCYIKHSIIELASDYELYFLLNNESALTYGHFYLKKYKKIIYPYWLRYIGLNDYQIKERLEKDSINVDNYIKINNNDEANMNIYEFVNFLVKQWETIITLSKKAKQK